MQDYPKTFPPSARAGFTVMHTWFAYAPLKTTLRMLLRYQKRTHITVQLLGKWPYISSLKRRASKWRFLCNRLSTAKRWKCGHVKPKCGIIKSKISGSCSISRRSTMALTGRDILDGALIINSTNGAEIKVGGSINKGWLIERIDYKPTVNLASTL
ncbi:hypothetical protein J1N35_013726 [Gossypium stocksii]|uniref:Uncharacterized protein n=1 Tax=Gossypium stocksii TaxID=47602 RepID=A0A9D3VSY8_9ROSI|nr:hypothetical protein J1N35_013726 [Gossypium stocksii]